jgi:hypothetical protein
VSWTPPSVSNTLSKCHKTIPRRASGLVQIANALVSTVAEAGNVIWPVLND